MNKNSCTIQNRFIRWCDDRRMRLWTGWVGCLLAASVAAAANVPLVLDTAQSRVAVEVHATVDSFTARLQAYEAAIAVDPDTAQVSQAHVSFRFTDVLTGKDDRDKQMHDWQDTAHFPDGSFRLLTLTPEAAGWMAAGTLTMHGQSREIRFPLTVTHEGDLYAIDGVATLDTRDFGLPVIRKFMVLKVDPVVLVRFHLQGRLGAVASE